jgi:hypothetical protein
MAVLEYPLCKVHGIPANHINMPKVISKDDEGYRYLLEAIKRVYDFEAKVITACQPSTLRF